MTLVTYPSLSCWRIIVQEDVCVEHVNHEEWGLGEIKGVNYDTDDPLVLVEWPDGRRGSYWVEELEFLMVPV